MLKKVIALCLGLVLSFASLSLAGSNPANAAIKTSLTFSDTAGHWSVQVVEEAAAMGLLSGYTDGSFKPDRFMTRLEAISIIIRAMGLDEEAKSISLKDSDIELPKGMTWGQEYLAEAVHQGLLAKNYVAALKYNESITRAEVATLIAVSLGLKGEAEDLTFSDSSSIISDYKSYVAGVTKAGIMSGIGNNEFGPTQGMKRGQMAALLSKLAEENWYNNTVTRVRQATVTSFDEARGVIELKNPDNTDTAAVLDDNLAIFDPSGKLAKVSNIQVGSSVYVVPYNSVLLEYIEILPTASSSSGRDLATILAELENNQNNEGIKPDNATEKPAENTQEDNSENTLKNNADDSSKVDEAEYYTSTDRVILKGVLLDVEVDKNRVKMQTNEGKVYFFTVSSSCNFYDEAGGTAKSLTSIEKNWQVEVMVENTLITEMAIMAK